MGNCFGFRSKKNEKIKTSNSAASSQPISRLKQNNFGVTAAEILSKKTTKAQNSEQCKPVILPTPRNEGEGFYSSHLKAFMFSELKNAAGSFHPDSLIGEGGFGFVYKGVIDQETVAVKKLKPGGFQGHKEWLSEVNYLSRLHHPNLVKLIGYCLEGESRLLVYEYMPKGSVENHLFGRDSQVLSWTIRMKVAIEAARGLCFLHESKQQIIYRDFKASNILLDSDFNAKLSDFGLAKEGPSGDNSHVTTQVIGTQGYAAPEYLATGHLTTKCDVYSFGVVLLELLSGRRAIDKTKSREEENLVDWAKPYLRNKRKIFRIMDTKLEGQYPQKGAFMVSFLALQCISDVKIRPSMSDVLAVLEKVPAPRNSHGRNSTAIKSPRGSHLHCGGYLTDSPDAR